jgi:hypothetical protein
VLIGASPCQASGKITCITSKTTPLGIAQNRHADLSPGDVDRRAG